MSIEENTKLYHGRGYILKKYMVPKVVYDYVWGLTRGAKNQKKRRKYHKFISHILANMLIKSKEIIDTPEKDFFVPIYSRLIDKKFSRDFDLTILKKNKLIEVKPHNTGNHESREFRIPNDIFNGVVKKMECILDMTPKGDDLTFVNLMTGKKVETKSTLYQSSNSVKNFNIPMIIKKSMGSLQPSPINLKNTIKWVKKMKRKYDHEKDLFEKRIEKCDDTKLYVIYRKEYRTHWGRYLNDLSSLNVIQSNNPTETGRFTKKGHPIFKVKVPYRIQKSGRLSEASGGFQSASRVMKHMSIINIPNLYNYDIKSSQAFILLQEMEKYGIKCDWLWNYLDTKDAKNFYAKKTGLPVDIWKKCFYAVIMGAKSKTTKGNIYEIIENYFKDDKITYKTYKRFLSVAAKLIKATKKWRDTLFSNPIKEHVSIYKGHMRWKNACGMIFKDYYILDKEDPKHSLVDINGIKNNRKSPECKRQLAAFILQGQEAFFIHWLTVLCSKHRIPVYRNEHDGLITGKKLPAKIIEIASIKSGFKEANIVIKPIISKEELKEKKANTNI